MYRLAIAAMVFGSGSYAAAATLTSEQRSQISRNVALYDELMVCAKKPEFAQYGLAASGPCGDWKRRVSEEKAHDLIVIRAGLSCLAGDIEMAGISMLRPNDKSNKEHLAWVKGHVDECRAALKG